MIKLIQRITNSHLYKALDRNIFLPNIYIIAIILGLAIGTLITFFGGLLQ